LGRGEIKAAVQISVHACSESAKAAIEQAGGSVLLIGS
jgi:ribosomal protein L15